VNVIKEGVKNHVGKYSYVWLDIEKFDGYLRQTIGCVDEKCGVLVKGNFKYRLVDNGLSLTAADLNTFLDKEAAGTLQNWMKSQDVPATADENNVRVLVGKNFVEEVKGKNVFVFFYASWCGHCKTSKPE